MDFFGPDDVSDILKNIGGNMSLSEKLDKVMDMLKDIQIRVARIEANQTISARRFEEWKSQMADNLQRVSIDASAGAGMRSPSGRITESSKAFINAPQAIAYLIYGMIKLSMKRIASTAGLSTV